jgi:hypothetical protein
MMMMEDFTSTPEGALMSACALGALMLALILWRTSQGARERARERARIWGEIKRPDMEARAQRKADARASGARADARLRITLMSAVALVALAATNLSAHATITAIQHIGLTSLDAAISAVIVFEAWLAILGALSLRHMTKGEGFNRYEAGVWTMASLMGVIAWWGGDSPIFALWPLLAAVAWHVVITFGRPHKPSQLVVWWRMKRGKATSQDASAVLTERLITLIVNTAYAANVGPKITRAFYKRAYDRAWARADALGILTPEVRARIQTRIAAKYAGARALAPEAVAHMNPWNERASMSTRTHARAVRPVSAPPARALEVSTHVPDDARALTEDARASETESAHVEEVRAPAPVVSAHGAQDLIDAVSAYFAGPEKMKEWTKTFVKTNGILPNRKHLAEASRLSEGNCGKWMTPVRKALGY